MHKSIVQVGNNYICCCCRCFADSEPRVFDTSSLQILVNFAELVSSARCTNKCACCRWFYVPSRLLCVSVVFNTSSLQILVNVDLCFHTWIRTESSKCECVAVLPRDLQMIRGDA
jgi:hypothetical protein